MASINYADREISVKIVYYGPGLSGKTTNLQVIHRKVPPEYKSDMVSLATETDRTLFFDFLPLDLGKIKGFSTKFQLYTVPGQVYYNATRKLVLRGVDGVVFVADSSPDKMQENIESFQNLEENLAEYGYKRETIPIILQYNKRDLPNALPVDELDRQFNKYNLPWTEAVANKGKGVFDSLKLIGKIVIDYLNKKYSRPGRSSANDPSGTSTAQRTQYPPMQAPQRQQQFPSQSSQPQMFQGFQQPPRAGIGQQPNSFGGPQYQQTPQQPGGFQQPMNMQVPPVRQPPLRTPQGSVQPMANPQQMIPTPSQMQARQFTPPLPGQNFQRPPAQGFPQQGGMRPPVAPQQQMFQQPPMQQPRMANQGIPPQQPSRNTAQYQKSFFNQAANQPQPDQFTDEVSFEPQNLQSFQPKQQMQQPRQEEDFYNYGNVNLNQQQQQFSQQAAETDSHLQAEESFELQPPPQTQSNSFQDSGNKTDLDLEIEKYQREIEEKQRRMRMQGQPAQLNTMQSQQNAIPPQQRIQNQMPMQNAPQFGQEVEGDYEVYNMELPGYQGQNPPPTQKQAAVPPSDNDDDMYFTSIDTDKQRKPIRKPLNPRMQQQQQQQQQKGFFSKFFNGNNRELP